MQLTEESGFFNYLTKKVVTAVLALATIGPATGYIRPHTQDVNANMDTGVDIAQGWGYTGNGSLVAIIDRGIDVNHSEFKGRIHPGGYNFGDDDNNLTDNGRHGTRMAGVVAAKGIGGIMTEDNRYYSVGAAPNATILPLKVYNRDGTATFSDIIRAIYYAVDGPDGIYGTPDDFNPAGILISLGTYESFPGTNCDDIYPAMTMAVDYAVSKNVPVVAAAGHGGEDGLVVPSCIGSAIAVGGLVGRETLLQGSGAGDSLDIVAPAAYYYSTVPGGKYGIGTGTSESAALVEGVIALMKEANRSLSVQEIKEAMYKTADDLGTPGWDNRTGWGRVNASKAIRYPGVCLQKELAPYDTDENCRIGKTEAAEAINDFFSGNLARQTAIAAVSAFFSRNAM